MAPDFDPGFPPGSRVVVTGAAGRIGQALLRQAAADGFVATGFDVKGAGLRLDIRDTDALARLCEGADCVFHVAGLHAPHVGQASDEDFRSINVAGTESVLAACKRAGVGRMVLTSTTALFGGGAAPGEPARWITEDAPTPVRTIYHETKLEAERLVQEAEGLETAILRIGRCFPEPIPEMIIHRLCRGIDPRDVADAQLKAMHMAPDLPEPLIICVATPFLPSDCADLGQDADRVISKRCPIVARYFAMQGWPLPKQIDRVYVSQKAQDVLGWRPKYGAEALIRAPAANPA